MKAAIFVIFLSVLVLCQQCMAAEYTYSVIYMGQDSHEEAYSISRSSNLPACIAMILRYHYRNSNINVLDVYRSGLLSYQYDGPAFACKNVGFEPLDLGFEILDDDDKDNIGAGKYYSKRKSGYWSSAIYSLDEVKQYLELWWGNVQAGTATFNSVVSEIKQRPVIIKVKYNLQKDHFFLLKGYDDKDTEDVNDDTFYVYDTYRNWTTQKNGDIWEIFSDGKGKFDYATLSSWYEASGNIRISFQTQLNKNEKRHSYVIDTQSIEIDKTAKNGDNYIWNEYVGSGNWYYPTTSGYSAKWIPVISKTGYYKLSMIYKGDNNPGGTINFLVSAADHYTSNASSVTVSQSNSNGWQVVDLSGRYFFDTEQQDISYIKVENVPANCRIDAIRFEYIDPITEGLKYLSDIQKTDGHWEYNENGIGNVGLTSIAVWAYLNESYPTTDSTVEKGIDYLLKKYSNNRFYADISNDYHSRENYDTALALLSLIATKSSTYQSYISNAGDSLKTLQNNDQNSKWYGGWSYNLTRKSGWTDLSNSQFSIMALKYAEAAGYSPQFETYLNRSQNYQEINTYCTNESDDGGYAYQPCGGSTFSMTGAGLWGLYLIGKDLSTDQRAIKAISWIESHVNEIYNGSTSWYMYTCLSFAKAMIFCQLSQYDQGEWYEGWYDKMSAAISKKQSSNGTFGTVYDTCFALLALQTLQPPPEDLSISVKLASPANLLVKDPEGNECDIDSCNIPGAQFVVEDGHVQHVILPDLQSGSYSMFFTGTDNGTCHLTVTANLGVETVYEEADNFDVQINDYLESDLIITSINGSYDFHFKAPEPVPPPPTSIPGKCKIIKYDVNKDNQIDALDITKMTTKWTKFVKGEEYNASCNFNNDGQIDIFDFMLISNCYGKQDDSQCYDIVDCP
ncbi:MAG: hypothetical protein HQK75_16350 [Candidatus Magnetomorum sp.]|nr:hypothetical protein [Candidatus Magnetomorum sp.]